MTDIGRLLDSGSGKTDGSNVDSLELNLILDSGGSGKLDTRHELDLADTLFSQKVTNLHSGLGKIDINGEMGVNKTHLVKESLSDSSKEIVNVTADRSDAGQLLSGSKPQVNLDKLLGNCGFTVCFDGLSEGSAIDKANVHGDVLEVSLEFSERSLDVNLTGMDSAFD